MRKIRDIVIVLQLVIICFMLCGCPSVMEPEAIKTGESFRLQIINRFHSYYNVEFDEANLPVVNISYQTTDGTKRTAVFQLDGYSKKADIGYKLVLSEDKNEWEEKHSDGEEGAPDLADEELIQKACLVYDYPIIFISAYQYQNDTGNKALENLDEFIQNLKELMETETMNDWAMNQSVEES